MTQLLELRFDSPPAHLITLHDEFLAAQAPTPCTNFLKGVKWSPDGLCFLAAADDNCLRVYDLPQHAFSLDGSVSGSDTDAQLAQQQATDAGGAGPADERDPVWPAIRVPAGELIYDFAWYSRASAADPASCCFATTCRGHPVHLWDACSGELRCSYRVFNTLDEVAPAYCIAFDPEGRRLYAGTNAAIHAFNVDRPGRDHDTLQTHSRGQDGQPGIISCLAFAPDSSGLMAAGSYSGAAALYDSRTSEPLAVLQGHTGGVTHLQFSADGTYLYSGARRDGELYCWDARHASGALYAIHRATATTNQRVYFDIEPCGRHLASGGEDGHVAVYDLRDGAEVARWQVAADVVTGCEFHPYLPLLAVGSGQRRYSLAPSDSESDSDDEAPARDGSEAGGGLKGGSPAWMRNPPALTADENVLRILRFPATLAAAPAPAAAQISQALSDDNAVDEALNKFLQREATNDLKGAPDEVEDPEECTQDIAVRWHTEVGSSVYATPLITDLFSDGRKDIIVPGFHRSLAVVEARDGARSASFEAEHRSTLHASPLLHDVDFDGVQDIVVATHAGEVHFFKDTGESAAYRFFIPRLRVKRDWARGLNPDPTDHSHPDVGADADDSGRGERGAADGAGAAAAGDSAFNKLSQQRRRRLMQSDGADPAGGVHGTRHDHPTAAVTEADAQPDWTEEAADSFDELFGEGQDDGEPHFGEEEEEEEENAPWLNEDDEDVLPFREYADAISADSEHYGGEEDLSHVLHGHDVRSVLEGHRGKQERPHGVDLPDSPPEPKQQDARALYGDYASFDYHTGRHWWDDEFSEAPPDSPDDKGSDGKAKGDVKLQYASPYIYVDAHVLATPAIGDIDGDGVDDLVVPVSYFFDPGAYDANPSRAALVVGKDGDINDYVASGVVVLNLHTRVVKWSQHLDLSTAYTRYTAKAYCPPTLADLDKDGRLEVIMGTSMGFLYVLDATSGATLEGWPVQMGDITGQVAVGDLDGDGWLELVAGDARGSVAAFNRTGGELWERHLGGAVGAGATLADVDGDGALEVIVGTFDGRVHVLNGATGEDKAGFPFRTYGRITAPILATKLDDPRTKGLQLVTTSHDGYLYVIDALTGCADSLDLGEPSYSMVLADDLAGSGQLDLLASTVGGNMYALRTGAKFHPLKAWPAQTPGVGTAGCTSRWSWQGVYASAASRTPRDVRGETVPVRFTLLDQRPKQPGGALRGPYRVSVSLHGVGAKEMNAGDQPVIGMLATFNKTGTYTMEVPCPRSRTTATLRVEVKDETGAAFSDEFSLSFHVHFYRLLKWLIVAPFAFTAAALLAFNGRAALATELPS